MCQNEVITYTSPSIFSKNSQEISTPDKDLSNYIDYIDKPHNRNKQKLKL